MKQEIKFLPNGEIMRAGIAYLVTTALDSLKP